jgi:phosphoribosylamine--glycine ligase
MRSPQKPELLAAPGNAGIARDRVECLDLAVDDIDGIVATAKDRGVDMVVVGPEAPLVAGLVDALADARIRAFGPSGAAARIEGSKAYAKDLMRDVGIPTAGYAVFKTREQAAANLACFSFPAVLKADGLAAGKGVLICPTEQEARDALDVFFGEERFGRTRVVVEEFLEGEELSLLALCDGQRAIPMPDGPGPGLQADLRRRRGSEHGRHGFLFARARHRRRARPGARCRRAPADRR